MLNQARLKVLKVREDHVKDVLEEARKKLGQITGDDARYGKVLHSLILQALFQLMETQVTIKVRERDQQHVSGLLDGISAEYKERIGREVTLKVDSDGYLPIDTCGGVELVSQRGRIKIVNTLESRLDLIAQQLLPDIRGALFGRNPNRKFAD